MTAQASRKVFPRFTAVDLVTIAVFGALWRAMWYVWNIFSFLFPFNQALNTFFGVLCTVAALVIVRKVGAATLMNIAAALINVLLQGELLTVAIIVCSVGVLADVYCYLMLRAERDPFSSWRDMLVAGALTALTHNVIMWLVFVKLLYKIPLPDPLVAAAFALGLVGGVIGGGAGLVLANRIKGLIG